MRLINADELIEKFKEHYELFVSAYENEQNMSIADRSRVDEILNSMAEVINAPTIFDTDNATNGDVIKLVFGICLDDFKKIWGGGSYTDDIWNAPYQKRGK